MSNVLFRRISVTILVISCNLLAVAQIQQALNETTEIDVLESVICEEPRRCLPHYQCLENGTYNIRGFLTINPRFDDEDSDTLRDGNEVYDVPLNNSIMLKSGVEAKVCHYLERCCGNDTVAAEPKIDLPTVMVSPVKGCGYRNPDGICFKIKTANDNQSQYGEFPWVIAVLWSHPDQKASTLVSGGSLIHTNVILTAGHIVFDKTPAEIKIRAGEWDTQTEQENIPHQERSVKKIVVHEHFYRPKVLYDIALVIVDEPFVLTESIQPICLPAGNIIFDNVPDCYSAGWGKDKFSHEGRRQSIMKKVRLPIVPFEKCEEQLRRTRLGEFYELHESFMCAGGIEGQDTCTGDGGAPLVCPDANDKNRYYQTGIVAWGIGCGGNNIPGVYADVRVMKNWIDRNMILEGFGTDSYTVK